ncbi:hypothetical protein BN2475_120156 [Paraburkholderia ribeironis]|uniref:Uncharacterized protein n=1 Tax=Paraburkholderia ribeironis TaxID=1247936 RepID=A0A1N7RRE7_9BURK|nr:hypothetical protein BN2475_120156 [Paraburkholderia ribeironis]
MQHGFLRRKKIFHIVKYGEAQLMGEKKPVPEHRFLLTDGPREAVRVFYTLMLDR